MRTVTLELEPPCDLINANQRLHYHPKARLTAGWRQATRIAVENGFNPYHFGRARIVVAIRFPNNIRRDVGNYYPTAKAIVDGLVDSRLIHEDNDLVITGPDMRRDYPNGPLRVTVTITEETPS
jgi:crossover junction endodeoxyribonuclease RusA